MQYDSHQNYSLAVQAVVADAIDTGSPPLAQAAKRKRTTGGCWTCKKRKVRCTQERPRCRNCSEHRVGCEGYGIQLSWNHHRSAMGSTFTAARLFSPSSISPPPFIPHPSYSFVHEHPGLAYIVSNAPPPGIHTSLPSLYDLRAAYESAAAHLERERWANSALRARAAEAARYWAEVLSGFEAVERDGAGSEEGLTLGAPRKGRGQEAGDEEAVIGAGEGTAAVAGLLKTLDRPRPAPPPLPQSYHTPYALPPPPIPRTCYRPQRAPLPVPPTLAPVSFDRFSSLGATAATLLSGTHVFKRPASLLVPTSTSVVSAAGTTAAVPTPFVTRPNPLKIASLLC